MGVGRPTPSLRSGSPKAFKKILFLLNETFLNNFICFYLLYRSSCYLVLYCSELNKIGLFICFDRVLYGTRTLDLLLIFFQLTKK